MWVFFKYQKKTHLKIHYMVAWLIGTNWTFYLIEQIASFSFFAVCLKEFSQQQQCTHKYNLNVHLCTYCIYSLIKEFATLSVLKYKLQFLLWVFPVFSCLLGFYLVVQMLFFVKVNKAAFRHLCPFPNGFMGLLFLSYWGRKCRLY